MRIKEKFSETKFEASRKINHSGRQSRDDEAEEHSETDRTLWFIKNQSQVSNERVF